MSASEGFADARTLAAIDFADVRARVVRATQTVRGRARAEELVPLADPAAVALAQARTSAARALIAAADLHVLPAADVAPAARQAAQGRTLGAADLRALADALAAAAAAHRAVREDAILLAAMAGYAPLPELVSALDNALDARATVLDRASPALGRLRRELAQAHADARDRVSAVLRSARHAKAIQDHVVTLREGRFVVPVKAEFAGEVPGIVHDTSASGATVFVEPLAALEANNRVRRLRIEEEREVARILDALSQAVGARAAAVDANLEALATLDLLVAKGRVAIAMDAVAPVLTAPAEIRIVAGRHPLLDGRAVPQSVTLDETTRAIVISGPNMGGKTVTLKLVGLFLAMTYAGLQLPAAAGTTIGDYRRVIADVGDEQSIAGNASTFSAHLARMRELLDRADARTLAIVDEIGGGTEPGAGAALAIALLEALLARGTTAVVTTHATEVKLFAHGRAGVGNASVRFDPQTFAPTYELDLGSPGGSMAFALARRMGIAPAVVARAEALLGSRERDYEAALRDLAVRAAELRDERARAAEAARQAAAAQASLAAERRDLEAARRDFAARAEERLAAALRDFVAELRARPGAAPRVSAGQAGALARAVEALRADLGVRDAPAAPAGTGSLAVDADVRVRSLRQNAVVVEDYGDTVLVAIGAMKSVVRKDDLEPVTVARPRRRTGTSAAAARLDAVTASGVELDVRGKRYAEAEPLVERWIDGALLAGSTALRLIHGKGTGALGRGLQEYLRAHPAVAAVRYGNEDEGSSGVSVIALRR